MCGEPDNDSVLQCGDCIEILKESETWMGKDPVCSCSDSKEFRFKFQLWSSLPSELCDHKNTHNNRQVRVGYEVSGSGM